MAKQAWYAILLMKANEIQHQMTAYSAEHLHCKLQQERY